MAYAVKYMLWRLGSTLMGVPGVGVCLLGCCLGVAVLSLPRTAGAVSGESSLFGPPARPGVVLGEAFPQLLPMEPPGLPFFRVVHVVVPCLGFVSPLPFSWAWLVAGLAVLVAFAGGYCLGRREVGYGS